MHHTSCRDNSIFINALKKRKFLKIDKWLSEGRGVGKGIEGREAGKEAGREGSRWGKEGLI